MPKSEAYIGKILVTTMITGADSGSMSEVSSGYDKEEPTDIV